MHLNILFVITAVPLFLLLSFFPSFPLSLLSTIVAQEAEHAMGALRDFWSCRCCNLNISVRITEEAMYTGCPYVF